MSAKREFHFQIYKHVRKCQTAQSLVEFALTLPLLLLILLGAVDLGRVFNASVAITNASREAARYGMSNLDDTTGIKDHAIQEAAGSGVTLNYSNIMIECYISGAWGNCLDDSGNPLAHNGEQIRVTVNHAFSLVSLYIFKSGNIQLSDYTIMAVTSGLTE
jgi:Flp pilus assembly protein TadG